MGLCCCFFCTPVACATGSIGACAHYCITQASIKRVSDTSGSLRCYGAVASVGALLFLAGAAVYAWLVSVCETETPLSGGGPCWSEDEGRFALAHLQVSASGQAHAALGGFCRAFGRGGLVRLQPRLRCRHWTHRVPQRSRGEPGARPSRRVQLPARGRAACRRSRRWGARSFPRWGTAAEQRDVQAVYLAHPLGGLAQLGCQRLPTAACAAVVGATHIVDYPTTTPSAAAEVEASEATASAETARVGLLLPSVTLYWTIGT